MFDCGSLVGSIPARVSTIEKMLELDFDRIENEYLYNGPSFRSFHANPAIMLADMRDSMQPLIVRPHNPPTKSLPLQTLNCRHHNIAPQLGTQTSSFQSTDQHMSFIRTAPLRSLLKTRTFTTTTRIMAPKQEWLVILPDQSGKLAERNQVRAYVQAGVSNHHVKSRREI
jgi:hypothetical protein